MNIFGLDISLSRKAASTISIDTLMQRLEAVHQTLAGISVTPDSALESPTVQALDTAISRRIATLPVHVYQKTTEVDGKRTRVRKEQLPNHPVERLLARPNEWESATSYWLDATSWLVRWGNHYAFKGRGITGPIRRVQPLPPGAVEVEQADDLSLVYHVQLAGGARRDYTSSQVHHARGRASNGFKGDSPIMQVREAIALEIAAERFGASFFGNGAMPGFIFQFAAASAGFKTDEERRQFVEDFQSAYGRRGRFKAMLLPKGIEKGETVAVENDKAQFLETRQHQRTVIAGAFGVPPHLVGDLSKGTYNNVEQQSIDFVTNVVLPYVKIFEAAMERDYLTDSDRANGIIIRFNLDGALRGDFVSRQTGLNIQRNAGVINANDWRENENMNPISEEDGGEEYWRQGQSGQTAKPPGAPPAEPAPTPDPAKP